MSEGPEVPEESLSRSTSTSQTAGALLRAAREREGLHVAALAVSIKVPVKKLEALEADRLDLLPDAVFVRALAGSVCRALKIDPVSVLDLLPSSGPPKLRPDGRGINTPFDSPRAGGGHNLKNAIARPPTVIVIVLLLAALGVFLFPDASTELAGFEQKSEQEGVRPTASESITAPGSAAPEAIATKATAATAGTDSRINPVNVSANGVDQTAKPAPSPVSAASTSAPQAIASGAELSVTFRAKGAAWVQVTDSKGVQLISRVLNAGEVVMVSGQLPYAVIVGRSDLTTLEVNGKVFELGRYSQNNVARFELKP